MPEAFSEVIVTCPICEGGERRTTYFCIGCDGLGATTEEDARLLRLDLEDTPDNPAYAAGIWHETD